MFLYFDINYKSMRQFTMKDSSRATMAYVQ